MRFFNNPGALGPTGETLGFVEQQQGGAMTPTSVIPLRFYLSDPTLCGFGAYIGGSIANGVFDHVMQVGYNPNRAFTNNENQVAISFERAFKANANLTMSELHLIHSQSVGAGGLSTRVFSSNMDLVSGGSSSGLFFRSTHGNPNYTGEFTVVDVTTGAVLLELTSNDPTRPGFIDLGNASDVTSRSRILYDGKLKALTSNNASFVQIAGADPLVADDFATKRYADALVAVPAFPFAGQAGLVGAYRGDGATVVGGLVTSWTDQSGAGNHFVQATVARQPAYVAQGAGPAGLNLRPVVRFSAAGPNYLICPAFASVYPGGWNTLVWVFVVTLQGNNTDYGHVFSTTDASGAPQTVRTHAGTNQMAYQSDSGNGTARAEFPTATNGAAFSMYGSIRPGNAASGSGGGIARATIQIPDQNNGAVVSVDTGASVGVLATGRAAGIGVRANDLDGPYQGDIGEILIFNVIPPQSLIDVIVADAMAYFGV